MIQPGEFLFFVAKQMREETDEEWRVKNTAFHGQRPNSYTIRELDQESLMPVQILDVLQL